jgi:methylenetetrahydrofolate--tRNA-(uracil-5-)-methyltransferase
MTTPNFQWVGDGKIGVVDSKLTVIGGGLAGSEAAWQAAERGVPVRLYEMRPAVSTGAHTGPYLAELVCSNSLGSNQLDRASGLLKEELRRMGSLLLRCAEETAVPAGGALAVDREAFAQRVTDAIEKHPNIELVRQEVAEIPATPTVVASGPLTSPALSHAVQILTGQQYLYFYDAIAPIVTLDSLNFDVVYRASRYGKGDREQGDYINCPMTKDEYMSFVDALVGAERIELKEFERELETGVRAGLHRYFEGCLPVEILAKRGREALAYGPLRPVGLNDPRTGRHPFAVVQLRQDNLTGTLYNLVGFQTNLSFPEQQRVLRMIPGLENAEFVRFGQMHRNTFIFSPGLLRPSLQYRTRDDLFFAGQIIGVEGYMGNIATGLLAGWNVARYQHGQDPIVLPPTIMLGALCRYITEASAKDFQPVKANFGILTPYDGVLPRSKSLRNQIYAERALTDLATILRKSE